MPQATYVQDSFLGGEKSQLAQGRITEKDYRTWMNVCVNGHPTEGGGWVRRAGTAYAQHTRGGANGRVIRFDYASATPYTIELTDGSARFRTGTALATTNDAQTVTAISAANPAVVTTGTHGWSTGNTVMFSGLGSGMPLLQNRQFKITVTDGTHFSLQDALTGANIDGSTLGAFPGGAVTVSRIQEVVSPYVAGNWASVRAVQAETSAVLLHGSIATQVLTATPVIGKSAIFTLNPAVFLDGPYLDPFTNGVQALPNATKGIILLTLQFPTYDSAKAYKVGDFVLSAGVNYISIIDQNVGNVPAGSPSAWTATSAGAAINNGQGFLGTDVGRLVRLLSEPAPWAVGTAYVAGNIVSYNPSGAPGASTYWTALVNNTGKIPGNDLTNWTLTPGNAAIWTWGKITSLANQISQATGTNIGTMTAGGGIAAAFDNNTVQTSVQSASASSAFNFIHQNFGNQTLNLDHYVGKNYTGSPKAISSVTVFPSTDIGFANVVFSGASSGCLAINSLIPLTVNLTLRAKASAPSSASDGTVLGTVSVVPGSTAAVSITSSDQVTTWNYVWIEYTVSVNIVNSCPNPGFDAIATLTAADAETQFFTPPGTGSGNACNVEILGPALLYTNACITWRLGAYSGTTGWPTCGTYHEGRIWLSGAIGNRFDASVSNGFIGNTINFAPTDQNGVVGAANAISGTMNSDGVNPIFWMTPDLQGIIAGSLAGEWLISAPAPGAMSPTNINARRVTKIGCANVEPRKTDHTNVFVQRYTRKLMEYFTDVYSGKFAAPNLAKDTLHITNPGISEIAYSQAVVPVIWGRNSDGSWWGAIYKRDTLATSAGPTINGWHRHRLGSGRSVQSICTGPSVGGTLDALTMVTLNPVSGIYHVEVMTDTVDEGDTLLQATYLDDAVNPTSTTTSNVTPSPYGGLMLNGLWHLNGLLVTAWLGGLDCGDYTVANGSITVPYGDGISAGTASGLFTAVYAAGLSLSQMLVGFTFTSQGQVVRPATPQESGTRNGPAVGKKRRNHKFAVQLEGTGTGVSFGTTFAKVDPARLRFDNDVAYAVNQQFTGIHKDTITDNYSYDGMVCWQITRPYPCNIANIAPFLESTDE